MPFVRFPRTEHVDGCGFPHPVCAELEKVASGWRSLVAVSLNFGGPDKIGNYTNMHLHAKHNTKLSKVPDMVSYPGKGIPLNMHDSAEKNARSR